ncbi:hypothetical protein QJS10_CPA03g00698 [Acorus calamus]|uniref:Uncharacterized protein n=1 Tax=Acorus calamus TaxID=4465 RepID=A0AAV9F8L5_ACOCL|nr:hypothetical protein QJS10_CPA03g00698 [Acorus calamus]
MAGGRDSRVELLVLPIHTELIWDNDTAFPEPCVDCLTLIIEKRGETQFVDRGEDPKEPKPTLESPPPTQEVNWLSTHTKGGGN